MLQAIGSFNNMHMDADYQRIIRELRALGLYPTGNKTTDAQKLALAKEELVQRIHKKEESIAESQQNLGVQVIGQVDENESAQRMEFEEQRLGAMTVAQLNKIYFGL